MSALLKRLLIFIGVLLALHLLIIVSGNQHLYPTLQNTIFKGRFGPEIDEFNSFANREVKSGEYEPWNESFSELELTSEELAFHQELKSIGFLVIHKDSVRFEQYWEDYNEDSRSNSFSMAKSLVSIAIGAAIQDGYIQSLDQTIGDFLPEFKGGDQVSLRALLQMSSGINFDEHYINPFAYPARANYGSDLISLTMSYQADGSPGESFKYLSGNTQLLAFVVAKATGMTVSDYFSLRIWSQIGAKNTALWTLDTEGGNEKAFCCFNSNIRDFARIGKLYLQNGSWNGKQLVPSWFVRESVRSSGLLEKREGANTFYGYQWWLLNYNGKKAFYARGILGQYIIVVPEDELIVCRLGHKRIKPSDNRYLPGEIEPYLDMGYRLAGLN